MVENKMTLEEANLNAENRAKVLFPIHGMVNVSVHDYKGDWVYCFSKAATRNQTMGIVSDNVTEPIFKGETILIQNFIKEESFEGFLNDNPIYDSINVGAFIAAYVAVVETVAYEIIDEDETEEEKAKIAELTSIYGKVVVSKHKFKDEIVYCYSKAANRKQIMGLIGRNSNESATSGEKLLMANLIKEASFIGILDDSHIYDKVNVGAFIAAYNKVEGFSVDMFQKKTGK